MCHLICSLMDGLVVNDSLSRDLICFVEDRLGHDWRYAVGTGKIAAELAWAPRETFETGIARTIGWYFE